jgi:exodeoxyribonuclease V alpha subunit
MTTTQEALSGEITRLFVPRDPRDFKRFVVFKLAEDNGDEHSVAGFVPALPPVGSVVKCEGGWENGKYGKQFKATSISVELPSTKEGAVRYLQTFPNIGPSRAEKIVAQLGATAPEQIIADPSILERFLGDKHAAVAANAAVEAAAEHAVERQLHDMKFGTITRMNIREKFGRRLASILARNPYLLVTVPRVSFSAVDASLMKLQRFPTNSPFRAAAAILQALKDAQGDGHTYLTPSMLGEYLNKLKLAHPIPEEARQAGVEEARDQGEIMYVDGGDSIALAETYQDEIFIADTLKSMLANSSQNELTDPVDPDTWESLTDEQRQAVENARKHPVSVLTGGPGTGKTFTLKAILQLSDSGLIHAPTGKAALRAREVTGRPTMTMHMSALRHRYDQNGVQSVKPPRVIFIDEMSMVSNDVLAMLLRIMSRGDHHLVLIGDIDQLPSVGAGAVLRDLIDCGRIPVTRLTKIHRQAEGNPIIVNAHALNKGGDFSVQSVGDQWMWMPQFNDETNDAFAARIAYKVEKACEHFKLDIYKDVQVLSPMRKGPIGTGGLNDALRERFNSNPSKTLQLPKGRSFRVGDKVINTANNYEAGIVNGDVGVVVDVADKSDDGPAGVCIEFAGREPIWLTGAALIALEQAWALTVHKSQGSEYKLVFVICHSSHMIMLNRQLLYTAITRASERLVLCGNMKGVSIARGRTTQNDRKTLLKGLMK